MPREPRLELPDEDFQGQSMFSRREFLCSLGAASLLSTPGCASWRQNRASTLKAGAAKVRVTPPIWVPYLTSSGNGTCAPFSGVHDELFARALVINDERQAVAILSVDAIGYDDALLGPGRNFTAEVRKRVAARTGLRPEAILVASTHSHSTPETICLSGFRDMANVRGWLEEHLSSLVDAVVLAWKRRVPVRMFSGKQRVDGVARNRRVILKDGSMSRYGPMPPVERMASAAAIDEELSFVCFETLDGSPYSVFLNFTAHPVVAMLLPHVSSDFPGVACAVVEKHFGGAICLFTNGAAGNINTVAVSTSFEDVQCIGERLGVAAVNGINNAKSESAMRNVFLGCLTEKIELQPRQCPSLQEAQAMVQREPSGKNRRLLRLAMKLFEGPMIAEVQGISIGPVKIVTMPGEAFVETGLALKAAGAFSVVGYANGWLGYFPIRSAYGEGGYEVEPGAWSRVAPGSAEALQRAGENLLKKLDA